MVGRRGPVLFGVALLAILVAVPVLAAKPSSPPGQSKDKAAKVQVTIHGAVSHAAGGDYTLTDGGTTYTLEAGPPWFFGDGKYPLDPYVGQTVTIVGEKAADSNHVDVLSVNGATLREPGKPPWAGGWKRVGERHPGWSQEKADRMKARFGDCFPPGQCKDKLGHGPDASEEPEESPGT